MPENPIAVGPLGWALFLAFILGMLALDLVVFNRRAQRTSVREALFFSALWVGLALCFAAGLWRKAGPVPATQFLSGYLLELSLSVDNLFVFLLIFAAYKVPPQFLRKALFWGILGAIVLRMAFIGAGAVMIEKAHWVLYGFGAFLVFTGFRLLLHKPDAGKHAAEGALVRGFRRLMPVAKKDDAKGSFFVRQGGAWAATPLLLVVLVIESTDVLFAVDSIPAVFGVTRDPFIVYTSNIFAILGLRSMFFALEGLMHMFRYLTVGLAVILVLIGLKLCFMDLVEARWGIQHVEFLVLGGVLAILAASVGLSVLIPAAPAPQPRRRR